MILDLSSSTYDSGSDKINSADRFYHDVVFYVPSSAIESYVASPVTCYNKPMRLVSILIDYGYNRDRTVTLTYDIKLSDGTHCEYALYLFITDITGLIGDDIDKKLRISLDQYINIKWNYDKTNEQYSLFISKEFIEYQIENEFEMVDFYKVKHNKIEAIRFKNYNSSGLADIPSDPILKFIKESANISDINKEYVEIKAILAP